MLTDSCSACRKCELDWAGCSDERAEATTQRLCFMVEKYMMPVNVVDNYGFRELLNNNKPGYRIPLRGTITSGVKDELKTQLLSADKLAITDCRTALTGRTSQTHLRQPSGLAGQVTTCVCLNYLCFMN